MSTYEQFDKHFAKVAGWVILKEGEYVARAACKYPADGMGRCYFYLQVWGVPMVRGHAGGCGYDKTTAAAHAATRGLAPLAKDHERAAPVIQAICSALDDAHGERWSRSLEDAGFTVLHVFG